ncbi:tetratricopeptide repeat protein [Propionispora vibrioides]|uniref:Glycosyltransferase family 9 (Heptosyltransferase) n=1 Tax=Propionispora vibrioides TaxID=112903 RepID=A0A1H8XMK2_9FIRM|nr:tetratricopeptide repeat protein [Propionispora vibrioides]SEP41334.1 Glycosyltransferase family 9 (heptosyltransferase) [Propionispora vibrioides]
MQLLPYHEVLEALSSNNIQSMEKAREICSIFCQSHPDSLVCLSLLGDIEYRLTHFPEAAEYFEKALKLQPNSPELYYNHAQALVMQGKYTEAAQTLQQAAQFIPGSPDIYYFLGWVHDQQGNKQDALEAYQQTLTLAPDHLEALNGLGILLMEKAQLTEAIEYFQRVLSIDPDYFYALINLGSIYHCQNDFTKSIALFKRALVLQPDYPIALNNLGVALHSTGDLAEAVTIYRRSLALSPANPEPHVNLAMSLLSTGQLEEGWREFEWRLELIKPFSNREKTTKPRWQGEAIPGRILLIRGEQGYGDTLQFCRYASMAADQGLRVVLEVQPPLVRLLHSLLNVEVIPYGEPLPDFDYYCPMLSLPLAFQTRLNTIPHTVPYLSIPPEDIEKWHRQLPPARRTNLKVGIVWSGKQRDASIELSSADTRRSIHPSWLAPILSVDFVQFYSLQKEGPPAPQEFPLVDMMNACNDFADTAALIANLDLIITVDTAVCHLAGAMGKPVWLLVHFNSCWRWLQHRQDSPWYPTLRLFRQPQPNDWTSVINGVEAALRQLLKETSEQIRLTKNK